MKYERLREMNGESGGAEKDVQRVNKEYEVFFLKLETMWEVWEKEEGRGPDGVPDVFFFSACLITAQPESSPLGFLKTPNYAGRLGTAASKCTTSHLHLRISH